MQYLSYFILFCIFDDRWRFDCRSPESAGKNTVKILNFCNSRNSEKIQRFNILPEDEGSQKGDRRGPQGAHTPPRHDPTLGRTWGPPGGPVSPPAAPFRVYDPFDLKIEGGAWKKYSATASGAETIEREKALRHGEICWGNSFPERGVRRHRHHHRHGLHRDHHQHHPHRQHHHPHSSTPVRRCI